MFVVRRRPFVLLLLVDIVTIVNLRSSLGRAWRLQLDAEVVRQRSGRLWAGRRAVQALRSSGHSSFVGSCGGTLSCALLYCAVAGIPFCAGHLWTLAILFKVPGALHPNRSRPLHSPPRMRQGTVLCLITISRPAFCWLASWSPFPATNNRRWRRQMATKTRNKTGLPATRAQTLLPCCCTLPHMNGALTLWCALACMQPMHWCAKVITAQRRTAHTGRAPPHNVRGIFRRGRARPALRRTRRGEGQA